MYLGTSKNIMLCRHRLYSQPADSIPGHTSGDCYQRCLVCVCVLEPWYRHKQLFDQVYASRTAGNFTRYRQNIYFPVHRFFSVGSVHKINMAPAYAGIVFSLVRRFSLTGFAWNRTFRSCGHGSRAVGCR